MRLPRLRSLRTWAILEVPVAIRQAKRDIVRALRSDASACIKASLLRRVRGIVLNSPDHGCRDFLPSQALWSGAFLVIMAAWPYNTAHWKRMREQQLRTQPLCARCPTPTPATVADHKAPHRGDPALAFDPDNLQSLCAGHHSARKQMEEVHGYDPGVGDDGWPADPQHPANRRRE